MRGSSWGPAGLAAFASWRSNGILAYSASKPSDTQMSWFDRAGRRQGVLTLPQGQWGPVSIDRGGRRAIASRRRSANEADWWVVDLDRAVARRVADAAVGSAAAWSPAGDRIAYQFNKSGPEDLFVKSVDGAGAEEPLVASNLLFKNPASWTSDGKYVVFYQPDQETGWDLWREPVAGERKPEPIVRTPANEVGGWVSPDGRWIAYASTSRGMMSSTCSRTRPVGSAGNWRRTESAPGAAA